MGEREDQIYRLINESFRDLTLCLGGIFLFNQTDDKLIWTITNSIEDIYLRTIDRLDEMVGQRSSAPLEGGRKILHPHPAIEGLLQNLNLRPGKRRWGRRTAQPDEED